MNTIEERAARYAFGPNAVSFPSREKLALVALASLADDTGHVHASQDELCLAMNCTKPTIGRAVNGLIDRGLVENIGILGHGMRRQINLGALA